MVLAETVTETVDRNSGIKGKSDLKSSQISILEKRRQSPEIVRKDTRHAEKNRNVIMSLSSLNPCPGLKSPLFLTNVQNLSHRSCTQVRYLCLTFNRVLPCFILFCV